MICEHTIIKWKPRYTGYPAPSRECGNPAMYMVGEQVLCTHHTQPKDRTKENRKRCSDEMQIRAERRAMNESGRF